MQATQTHYDPAISGEVRRPLVRASTPVPWGADKVIARRAALELAQGDAVNLGFGISPLVPRILIEEGLAGRRDLDDRAGAGRRRAAHRLRVRLLGERARRSCRRPTSSSTSRAAAFDVGLLSFMEVGRGRQRERVAALRPSRTSPPAAAASSTSPRMRGSSSSPATSAPPASISTLTARQADDPEGRQVRQVRAARSSTSPSPGAARASSSRTSPTSPSGA